MKKLLVLVAVLALVAVLVVPMAAFAYDPVSIGGSVPDVASKIVVTLPTNIGDGGWALGNWGGGSALQVGENWAKSTDGNVTFTQGNDGVTGWSMTAQVKSDYIDPSDSLAHMATNIWLPSPIKISYDFSSFNYQGAGVGGTWGSTTNGSSVNLPLAVMQQVNTTDKAGVYYVYIVYTLTTLH